MISNNSYIFSNSIKSRDFILFLGGQGISSLGDAFHLIAVTSLLVQQTGSGLSATFGLICYPIASILFSGAAGQLGDILPSRFLVIVLDILRGALVLLCIYETDIMAIYILTLLLSILDILYNPPRRKIIWNLLPKTQLAAGNSMLSGVCGAAFALGPAMAGMVIAKYGIKLALLANCASFFFCALSLLMIKSGRGKKRGTYKLRNLAKNTSIGMRKTLDYCFNTYALRRTIFMGTIICFGTTSINLAFYPLAFDFLGVTSRIWGNMLSVFYGSNLVAMLVMVLIGGKVKKGYIRAIPFLLLPICIIWFLYGSLKDIYLIILLQFLEGVIVSIIFTYVVTEIQIVSQDCILGRVIGITDVINNMGKLVGIGITYIMLELCSVQAVFIFNAFAMLLYALYELVWIRKLKK